jgi:hypothetical protein
MNGANSQYSSQPSTFNNPNSLNNPSMDSLSTISGGYNKQPKYQPLQSANSIASTGLSSNSEIGGSTSSYKPAGGFGSGMSGGDVSNNNSFSKPAGGGSVTGISSGYKPSGGYGSHNTANTSHNTPTEPTAPATTSRFGRLAQFGMSMLGSNSANSNPQPAQHAASGYGRHKF